LFFLSTISFLLLVLLNSPNNHLSDFWVVVSNHPLLYCIEHVRSLLFFPAFLPTC
jgi:hypothetical protein